MAAGEKKVVTIKTSDGKELGRIWLAYHWQGPNAGKGKIGDASHYADTARGAALVDGKVVKENRKPSPFRMPRRSAAMVTDHVGVGRELLREILRTETTRNDRTQGET